PFSGLQRLQPTGAVVVASTTLPVSVPFSGLQRLQPQRGGAAPIRPVLFQSPSRGFNDCNRSRAGEGSGPSGVSVPFSGLQRLQQANAIGFFGTPPAVSVPFSGLQRLQLIERVCKLVRLHSFSPLLGASTTATPGEVVLFPFTPMFQSPSRGFNDCNRSAPPSCSGRQQAFQSPSRGFNDCNE